MLLEIESDHIDKLIRVIWILTERYRKGRNVPEKWIQNRRSTKTIITDSSSVEENHLHPKMFGRISSFIQRYAKKKNTSRSRMIRERTLKRYETDSPKI